MAHRMALGLFPIALLAGAYRPDTTHPSVGAAPMDSVVVSSADSLVPEVRLVIAGPVAFRPGTLLRHMGDTVSLRGPAVLDLPAGAVRFELRAVAGSPGLQVEEIRVIGTPRLASPDVQPWRERSGSSRMACKTTGTAIVLSRASGRAPLRMIGDPDVLRCSVTGLRIGA